MTIPLPGICEEEKKKKIRARNEIFFLLYAENRREFLDEYNTGARRLCVSAHARARSALISSFYFPVILLTSLFSLPGDESRVHGNNSGLVIAIP